MPVAITETTVYCTTESELRIMTFPEIVHDYYLRYRYYNDYSRAVYEIRYVDTKKNPISGVDVSFLTDASEEQMFQLSCTEQYDPYLIKAGMKAIHEYEITPGYHSNKVQGILEY